MNEQQALAVINRAWGKTFTSFAEVAQHAGAIGVGEVNEKLVNLTNKLVKMVIVDSFKSEMLEKYKNFFVYENAQIPIGTMIEIVDTALLTVADDKITTATDLLPNLTAIPSQYAMQLTRNIQKRIEVVINESTFRLAFTSINAFNNLLALILKRPVDTMRKYFYEFFQSQLFNSVKNIQDLGTAADSTDFLTNLYTFLGTDLPYSDKFNLGQQVGSIAPAPIDAAAVNITTTDASDKDKKINSIAYEIRGETGLPKFENYCLIINGKTHMKMLADLAKVFHDTTLAPSNIFGEIIYLRDDIYQLWLTANTGTGKLFPTAADQPAYFALIIDKHTLFNGIYLNAEKSQWYAKGEGEGIRNIIISFWNALGFIPWMNGFAVMAKQKTTDTTGAAPLPDKLTEGEEKA